jgi:hypothetical protein
LVVDGGSTSPAEPRADFYLFLLIKKNNILIAAPPYLVLVPG